MNKKTIIARVKVKAGEERAFIAAAKGVIDGTHQEEGNLSYTMYQSQEDSTQFLFYEEYTDDSAFQIHATSDYFNLFAQTIEPLLAADMIIESF